MSALAFIGGFFSALNTGLDILKQFRSESVSQVVGSGHATGFWDFCSYSEVSQIMLKVDLAEEFVTQSLIPKVIKCDTQQMKDYKDDIAEELKGVARYAELSVGETNKAFTTTSYSKNAGKLWFFVYVFNAETTYAKPVVRCNTMHLEIEMKMAQDWLLVNHIETSFMKAKNTFELQYLPKGIKVSDVQQAIAIALAPAVVGLIEMPDRFVKMLGAVINSTKEDDLPQYTSGTMQQITEQYNQMIDRRAQQDQVARDAVAEFGKHVPTLEAETGVSKNEWNYFSY